MRVLVLICVVLMALALHRFQVKDIVQKTNKL